MEEPVRRDLADVVGARDNTVPDRVSIFDKPDASGGIHRDRAEGIQRRAHREYTVARLNGRTPVGCLAGDGGQNSCRYVDQSVNSYFSNRAAVGVGDVHIAIGIYGRSHGPNEFRIDSRLPVPLNSARVIAGKSRNDTTGRDLTNDAAKL